MTNLSGLPYFEAEFDKHQKPVDPDLKGNINQWVSDQQITDLIVISHGWNNDMDEAREFYTKLVASIVAQRKAGSGGGLPDRALGVVGILWPAKKFADESLIPGGAASTGGDEDAQLLLAKIDALRGFFDSDPDNTSLVKLRGLVSDIEGSPDSRKVFFQAARSLLGPADQLDADDREEIPDSFFTANSDDEIADLFDELKKPDPPGRTTMPTSNGAAGFSPSGFMAGARRLLNYLTYYQMKKRARKTGMDAVNPLLRSIRTIHPALHIHLVGHSFGGLLVTSTAWGGDDKSMKIPVDTMALLQAAFSHNGFARDFQDDKDGRYREVLLDSRVNGPILVTHTRNDQAVGVAYALASRFSRQDAATIGGLDDRFGGIGANGARHTPEAVERFLEDPGTPYHFHAGNIYNLLADAHIKDHSDVRGNAVAHAIVEGIASVGPNDGEA